MNSYEFYIKSTLGSELFHEISLGVESLQNVKRLYEDKKFSRELIYAKSPKKEKQTNYFWGCGGAENPVIHNEMIKKRCENDLYTKLCTISTYFCIQTCCRTSVLMRTNVLCKIAEILKRSGKLKFSVDKIIFKKKENILEIVAK